MAILTPRAWATGSEALCWVVSSDMRALTSVREEQERYKEAKIRFDSIWIILDHKAVLADSHLSYSWYVEDKESYSLRTPPDDRVILKHKDVSIEKNTDWIHLNLQLAMQF